MAYKILCDDRREVVDYIEEITGFRPEYTGMPNCSYILSGISIELYGDVIIESGADMELLDKLIDAGLVGEVEDTTDSTTESLTPRIEFPIAPHTANSICNLVFTIYSKGKLINKSTGSDFYASGELVDELRIEPHNQIDDVLTVIRSVGDGDLKGLAFEDNKVIFDGFPDSDDPTEIRAWTILASGINQTAIKQKRVQPKISNEPNEKFAFRTWLTRLGLNGSEYKTERALLYKNLEGHTAFRTPEDQEKWTARQKAKKNAERDQDANGSDGQAESEVSA